MEQNKSCKIANSINDQLNGNFVGVMLYGSVNEVIILLKTQIQTTTANLHNNVTNTFSQENDTHITARLTISISNTLMYVVLYLFNAITDV